MKRKYINYLIIIRKQIRIFHIREANPCFEERKKENNKNNDRNVLTEVNI